MDQAHRQSSLSAAESLERGAVGPDVTGDATGSDITGGDGGTGPGESESLLASGSTDCHGDAETRSPSNSLFQSLKIKETGYNWQHLYVCTTSLGIHIILSHKRSRFWSRIMEGHM